MTSYLLTRITYIKQVNFTQNPEQIVKYFSGFSVFGVWCLNKMGGTDSKLNFRKAVVQLTTKTQVNEQKCRLRETNLSRNITRQPILNSITGLTNTSQA